MSDDEDSQQQHRLQLHQQSSPAQQQKLLSEAPMSDRVQSLASRIYTELESLMRRYGEDVVKELMPLIVGVLEGMERAISERRSQEAELEMLREDHEQLLAQFERERRDRKAAEERLMLAEDAVAEERAGRAEEREAASAASRLLELKARNAHELANRLEEKEAEARREFQRLHERHSELLRSHTEHVDRTRSMLAAAAAAEQQQLQQQQLAPSSFGRRQRRQRRSEQDFRYDDDDYVGRVDAEAAAVVVGGVGDEEAEEPDLDDIDVIEQDEQGFVVPIAGAAGVSDADEGADDVVGGDELAEGDVGDYSDFDSDAADNYGDGDDVGGLGVDREIENLIKENMDLIETKNALNIVKDDLIAKVDELTGEKELLRDEADCLRAAKAGLKERVASLEEESRGLRDEVEKLKARLRDLQGDDEDASVPVSQRKRFTRVEMSRILMERNEYKERLMELQEAVRYAEMLRASRDSQQSEPASGGRRRTGSSMWGFFNSLWSAVAPDEVAEGEAVGAASYEPQRGHQQQQQQQQQRPAANVLLQPLLNNSTAAGVSGTGAAATASAAEPLQLLPPRPPGGAQPKTLVLVPPSPHPAAATAAAAADAPSIDRGD